MLSESEELQIGKQLEAEGKIEEAIAIYESLLEQDPSNTEVLESLGKLYSYSQNYKQSIAYYRRLLEITPDDLPVQTEIARLVGWSGDFRKAIALYQAILTKNPEHTEARLGLAEVFFWSKKLSAALREYETILKLNPNNAVARAGQAQVLFWQGKRRTAMALYSELFEQFPNVPKVRLGLARLYVAQYQVTQALALLQPLLDQKQPEAIEILDEIQAIKLSSSYWRDEKTSGELNQFFSQTSQFRIQNSDSLQWLSLGWNSFDQDFIDSPILKNFQAEFGIEGQIDYLKLTGAIGFDAFDRLSAVPRLHLEADYTLNDALSLAGIVRYSAYKNNTQTLENQVAAWQFTPSVLWRIDRDTFLFLSYGLGLYNDGNIEQQFIAKAKRSLGQFFVSGSLVNWSYQKDPQTGYFAPPDFFLYSGEFGWAGKIFQNTECYFSVGLGQQSYFDRTQDTFTYQAHCNQDFSENLALELGYRYSNNPWYSNSNSGDFIQESIYSQLKIVF